MLICSGGGVYMKKTYILAGIAIFFWSTMATISKLLLGSFSGIQVLAISSFFAGMFLLIKNIVTHNIKKLKFYNFKDIFFMTLIGLPGIFLYNVFYYFGAAIMPASQAFIINYLWPIMSVVFACILLKEKMTVRKAIAFFMSFLGVVIVTAKSLGSLETSALAGAGCILFAAVCYGLFTALSQKFEYDKNISQMFTYFATCIITVIMSLISKETLSVGVLELLGFAWNGVFVMGVATTAWTIALESGNTAKISNLAYITPFASLIWTSLFLKEEISIFSVLGLIVIVAGILIQLKDKKKDC